MKKKINKEDTLLLLFCANIFKGLRERKKNGVSCCQAISWSQYFHKHTNLLKDQAIGHLGKSWKLVFGAFDHLGCPAGRTGLRMLKTHAKPGQSVKQDRAEQTCFLSDRLEESSSEAILNAREHTCPRNYLGTGDRGGFPSARQLQAGRQPAAWSDKAHKQESADGKQRQFCQESERLSYLGMCRKRGRVILFVAYKNDSVNSSPSFPPFKQIKIRALAGLQWREWKGGGFRNLKLGGGEFFLN